MMQFFLGFYILLTTVLIKVLCDCGITATNANPLDTNKNGIGADIFPWYVVIYEERSDGTFERGCFGNLISSDVVITAASCISDTPADLNRFYVVSGNNTPHIISSDMTIQKTRVKTLYKGKRYDKSDVYHSKSIAWFVLEHPLEITPACIDFRNQQDRKKVGSAEQVSYSPSVDNMAKPEIRKMEVINSSDNDCYVDSLYSRRHNKPLDSSCARLPTKTSSFSWFIGSGVYSQHDSRWYLRAIITVGYVINDGDGRHNVARMMELEHFIDEINNSGALKRCGIAAPPVKSLITNGFRAELGRFPWHVAVYRKGSNGKYSQICAGSLISANVVISAAHCFYDEVRRQKQDAARFTVAAGKFYRLYDAPESFVQKSAVLTIHLPRTYYGAAGNYAEDIAWIILQHPFYYSAVVSPVCIDADNSRQDGDLHAGQVGKVVGWGRTEAGVLSNELQEVNLPFIPYETCSSAIPSEFIPFITFDKFCAGYLNGSEKSVGKHFGTGYQVIPFAGTSLCDGDSGGGLAFYRGGTWYLRGIVSLSPASGGIGTCAKLYTAFTSVGYHIGEHRRIMNLPI